MFGLVWFLLNLATLLGRKGLPVRALLAAFHLDAHLHPVASTIIAHLPAKDTATTEVEEREFLPKVHSRCVESSKSRLHQEYASSKMGGGPCPSIVSTVYKKKGRLGGAGLLQGL